MFASHCSTEPAARLVLEALGKAPLLTAGLHLGEGTGAVASIPLWDMALAVYRDCYSFTEGGITGDLAGWFLQKAELWMLAALCACQWGGLL